MTTSFAVMAYNEFDPTRDCGQRFLRSLEAARKHSAIDEIVVVDDGSDDYEWLRERMKEYPEVNLYHNETNLGVFLNKIEIVAQSTSDWVITCDSDNHKDVAHIDKALSLPLDPDVWYCPSFAKPSFDYRQYIGEYDLKTIGRFDEGGYKNRSIARCCLNTGNQIVHRQTFLEVFSAYRGTQYWLDAWDAYKAFHGLCAVNVHERPKRYWRQVWDANDSMLFNMLWLFAGKRLAVVKGLEYEHYVAPDAASNYNRSGKEKGSLGDRLFQHLVEQSEAANR